MAYSIRIILALSIVTACSNLGGKKGLPADTKDTTEHWPTSGWQYDTLKRPSSLDTLSKAFPGKYALVVVNNGRIIFDHYGNPYEKDSLIHVNSCTKTVIAMLFGAVFQERLALSENRAAIDYFPEYAVKDSLIRNIKLRHFLSMSSGLEWKGGIDAADVVKMSETNDWAKYVFERKLVGPPGMEFHYNSGGTQVISTILDRYTEEGLMAFAQTNLFQPLGISELKWDSTSKGIPKAGWGLHLKIQDMAKLGYLLLHKGKWEDAQIVPEEWVARLSRNYLEANENYDYGYQVWIPKNVGTECFMFIGSYPPSKKIIAVLPELNSVVAYVGENYNTNDLLRDYIVPALKKLSPKPN